jgi:hypothetical protein
MMKSEHQTDHFEYFFLIRDELEFKVLLIENDIFCYLLE